MINRNIGSILYLEEQKEGKCGSSIVSKREQEVRRFVGQVCCGGQVPSTIRHLWAWVALSASDSTDLIEGVQRPFCYCGEKDCRVQKSYAIKEGKKILMWDPG